MSGFSVTRCFSKGWTSAVSAASSDWKNISGYAPSPDPSPIRRDIYF